MHFSNSGIQKSASSLPTHSLSFPGTDHCVFLSSRLVSSHRSGLCLVHMLLSPSLLLLPAATVAVPWGEGGIGPWPMGSWDAEGTSWAAQPMTGPTQTQEMH